jgi:hypothetical protein
MCARELHTDLAQHRDSSRPLAHADVDHHVVAQAGSGRHRIGNVRGEGVALAEHAGDTTLRVLGVRLVAGALGHDDHVTVRGCLERKRQPGDATTEHQIVANERHTGALRFSTAGTCKG